MYNAPADVNSAIPPEYRHSAEALFPSSGYLPGTGPSLEAAIAFAEVLGIGSDYQKLLSAGKSDREIHIFLGHFQNNLDLLIQKTWVEKADEARKERLQDQISGFIEGIEGGDYQKALVEFSGILEELAYLLFGAQSHKEDFTEYTLRIDYQLGLFWWYGGQLGRLLGSLNGNVGAYDEIFRAILLIGMCYLTNF